MIATLSSLPATKKPKAVVFGTNDHLVGVFEPEVKPRLQPFGVIMLTAGMLPSAGPFRLHVDLARSLAKQGVPSLRFDLSGIGESLATGSTGTSLERAATEIRSAIDYLEQHEQISQVALFGLCSGADDALYAAQQDERIVGLFSIDGCGYRTAKFYFHRLLRNYLPKLASGRAWKARFNRCLGKRPSVIPSLQLGSDLREFPDRQTAASQLHTLVQRGVQMHFHYTGGVGDYYNYCGQFEDMFKGTPLSKSGAIGQIETRFYPDSDHVAYLVEHRKRLVELATMKLVSMMKA